MKAYKPLTRSDIASLRHAGVDVQEFTKDGQSFARLQQYDVCLDASKCIEVLIRGDDFEQEPKK
jgi:hypothetical protein